MNIYARVIAFTRRRDFYVLSLLAIALLCIFVVINPLGDFPLNDDWSYATTTRWFSETRTWRPIGFTSMPLITNSIWAWPACALTSCSFEILRCTTLFASLVLLAATFLAVKARSLGVAAVVAAAAVVLNPISLALSFTFMTDVVFWIFFSLSVVALMRAIDKGSVKWVLLGTLAALAATMSRQLGLAPPIAFALTIALRGAGRRPSLTGLTVALTPAIVCGFAFLLLHHWLQINDRIPILYEAQSADLTTALQSASLLAKRLIQNASVALTELGLFLTPLLIVTRRPPHALTGLRYAYLPFCFACASVVLVVIDMAALHRIMPLGKDILVPEGIGPLTLRDTFILGLPNVPRLSVAWWSMLTCVALTGAFELIYRCAVFVLNLSVDWRNQQKDSTSCNALFLLAVMLIYSALPMMVSAYDRYFVALMPAVSIFLVLLAPRTPVSIPRNLASLGVLIVLASFSTAAVHDYMAWNRARWSAIRDLEASRLGSPATLDGGFEYNAMFNYDPHYAPIPGKSSWWVHDDRLILSFGPIAGFQTVRSYEYETLLPPTRRTILVLER